MGMYSCDRPSIIQNLEIGQELVYCCVLEFSVGSVDGECLLLAESCSATSLSKAAFVSSEICSSVLDVPMGTACDWLAALLSQSSPEPHTLHHGCHGNRGFRVGSIWDSLQIMERVETNKRRILWVEGRAIL